MAPTDHWPCWIDVDLDAIAANVRAIRGWIGARVRFVVVVKAHAYGLGAEMVATTALAAGADGLAVARVHEGVRLRQHGVRDPILLLTGFAPAEADAIVTHDLTPTIVEPEQLGPLVDAARRGGRRVSVHAKVDTGLRRYGAGPEALGPLLAAIDRSPWLDLEGFYTHFATADGPDLQYAREQLAAFRAARAALDRLARRPRLLHAANSAGTLALPEAHFDLVRVGLGVYGYRATPSVPSPVALRQAVTLRARVARLQDLPADCTVGYGRAYRTARPTRAALLTIGYADGLPGGHYQHGHVLLGGRRAPLIGRISMDQCLVDVTDCPGVRAGDAAVVLGQDGAATIELDDYAALSNRIPHEALATLGARVPRVYWQDGRVVASGALAGTEWLTDVPGAAGVDAAAPGAGSPD